MEQVTQEWLKNQIDKYHNGDRYEFAKAVKISKSAIEKFMCGQRELKPYHIDHFKKHFICRKNGLI